MKTAELILSILAVGALLIFASCSKNNETASEDLQTTETAKVQTVAWNKVCPVVGGDVNPDLPTVTYEGKVYGFCCPGCDKKFEADPEHYAALLSEDGSQLVEM